MTPFLRSVRQASRHERWWVLRQGHGHQASVKAGVLQVDSFTTGWHSHRHSCAGSLLQQLSASAVRVCRRHAWCWCTAHMSFFTRVSLLGGSPGRLFSVVSCMPSLNALLFKATPYTRKLLEVTSNISGELTTQDHWVVKFEQRASDRAL